MKTVSVIIPVYNTEEYLEQSIQSITNQTYKYLEIIVIDDGSQDKSYEILKRYAEEDDRIILLQHAEQKGVGATRNLGIKYATGKYIYFFDSDDYLPSETISYLVQSINGYDLIRGRMRNTELSTGFTVAYEGRFEIKLYKENKFNLIKNNSACNFLFNKKFIKGNNFCFSDDNKVYTDLFFMIPILSTVNSVPYLSEALYFRRIRNNPSVNPSIRQYNQKFKINEFLECYNELKCKSLNEKANEFLDTQFLNFYRNDIVSYFSDGNNIDDIYGELYASAEKMNFKILDDYDFWLRREIKVLLKGKIKRYKKLISRFNFLRGLKNALSSKDELYHFFYVHFFSKLQKNNKMVFFESFQGKSYSDNPKYIYEYMISSGLEYNYVWCLNGNEDIPGDSKVVKKHTLRYYYYLAKARYWISNSRMRNGLFKDPETVYLQTWHGTPLKKLAGDMEDIYMPGTNISKYKENFKQETSKWDYLISPNEYSTTIFKRAFWYNKDILEVGYPRNDILYTKNNLKDIEAIRDTLGLPRNKKIILYAPTWRDDEYITRGNYKFTLSLNLTKMQETLGNEYIVILRMHYLISSKLNISKYEGFAYDLSSYSDISELYLVSDILITDYSSVFFDYANLKRPILFYMYDIEKYRDQLRGFYLDLKDLPGPIYMDTSEIIQAIKSLESLSIDFKYKYEEFYDRFCQWDDGQASKKVVKKLFSE